MSGRFFTAALVAAALLAAPVALGADSHEEAPRYAHITHFRVDPAHADEWGQLVKDWVKAFADAGMESKWNWYVSVDNFDIVMVDFHDNMASFDHGEEMEAEVAAALGAETMAALQEAASQIDFEVVGTEVAKLRRDLSFDNVEDKEGPPGFLHVGVHTVRPGKSEEFEGLVKKIAGAYEQTGTPRVWDTLEVILGNGSYVVVVFAGSPEGFYAEKQIGEVLTEAYGEEEAGAMYAAWRDSISSYETNHMFPRPELSYIAEKYAGGEEGEETGAEMEEDVGGEESEGEMQEDAAGDS